MIDDYEKYTGIRYNYGYATGNEKDYFEDLIVRSTRGGSGINPKNIDLIIVADQLLTGYDSKRLNTLYVDRELELQSLIQAYSRTNRVYRENKEFGSIVNFKFPRITEEAVNRALKLYGAGGSNSNVIVDKYDVAVAKFNDLVGFMRIVLPDPTRWPKLEHDILWKNNFIESFKKCSRQLNKVKQYYQYEWDDMTFGLDEHLWYTYRGAYLNLREQDEIDPQDEYELAATTLTKTQIINAETIIKLIGEKAYDVGGNMQIDGETIKLIYEQISELSNMGEHVEAELLKEFVETKLLRNLISSSTDFDQAYAEWKKGKQDKEIIDYSMVWGIDKDLLSEAVNNYDTTKADNIPYFDDIIFGADIDKAQNQTAGNQLQQTMELSADLVSFIQNVKKKYS